MCQNDWYFCILYDNGYSRCAKFMTPKTCSYLWKGDPGESLHLNEEISSIEVDGVHWLETRSSSQSIGTRVGVGVRMLVCLCICLWVCMCNLFYAYASIFLSSPVFKSCHSCLGMRVGRCACVSFLMYLTMSGYLLIFMCMWASFSVALLVTLVILGLTYIFCDLFPYCMYSLYIFFSSLIHLLSNPDLHLVSGPPMTQTF